MKRFINISILILTTVAVQAHQLNSGEPKIKKEAVVEYVSLGNDFAKIKMEMYDNGKFIIKINPKDGKSLKLKGHWEKENNFYVLSFKKTNVAVNKLFNMNDPNRFQVLNEMNVKFSGHLSSLWIWGIQCKKSDII